MTVSMHAVADGTFVPMLRSLSGILGKAAAHAGAKAFDPAVLVHARLAPDMFPLVKQIQIACDTAKNGTARLVGREPPRFEDNEQGLDELMVRIDKTVAYLESVDAAAFAGAEERDITVPLGKEFILEMKGERFLRDWMLPNFYFHVVTAYDILRHNGVAIGKQDYLAHAGSNIRRRGGAEMQSAAAT